MVVAARARRRESRNVMLNIEKKHKGTEAENDIRGRDVLPGVERAARVKVNREKVRIKLSTLPFCTSHHILVPESANCVQDGYL